MSMQKRNPYIFNNEKELKDAEQSVHEKFPQLRTSTTSTALFIESRNSIVFDSVVENFVRTLGGIPRPTNM